LSSGASSVVLTGKEQETIREENRQQRTTGWRIKTIDFAEVFLGVTAVIDDRSVDTVGHR
jgi:hypothetical protein